MNVDAIDAVLVGALSSSALLLHVWELARGVAYMRRTKDSTVPVGHHQIVSISKTVRASLYRVV
jgi:hypothetical protein